MDTTAKAARLFAMIEALTGELDRQGVLEHLANSGFNITDLARVAVTAADGAEVLPFKGG